GLRVRDAAGCGVRRIGHPVSGWVLSELSKGPGPPALDRLAVERPYFGVFAALSEVLDARNPSIRVRGFSGAGRREGRRPRRDPGLDARGRDAGEGEPESVARRLPRGDAAVPRRVDRDERRARRQGSLRGW